MTVIGRCFHAFLVFSFLNLLILESWGADFPRDDFMPGEWEAVDYAVHMRRSGNGFYMDILTAGDPVQSPNRTTSSSIDPANPASYHPSCSLECRASSKKHLVSYFVLLDEVHQKILLVDHKKALLWLPTGGHVENNEDLKTTVERECLEELG